MGKLKFWGSPDLINLPPSVYVLDFGVRRKTAQR